MDSNAIVIIPAYNEEKSISQVVSSIKKLHPDITLVVIDDESSDNTANLAANEGTVVLSHPFNMGYGASVQTGYKYALEKGYQVLVQMDADGQHEPQYISNLLSALKEGNADVVIGSRFLGKQAYRTSLVRRIGMVIFGRMASLIIKQRVTDPTSGFQAMNRRVIEFFTGDFYPADYPDADVMILLHFAGFRIKEVPVVMYPSLSKKSIHAGYKPLYYIFKMFLSIIMTLLREKPKGRR